MKVLVVNVGSTSVKYNLYEMDTEARLAVGKAERMGTPDAVHVHEAGQVGVDGDRHVHIGRGRHRLDDQLVDAHLLEVEVHHARVEARDLEQVLDELLEALDVGDHQVERGAGSIGHVVTLVLEHLDRSRQRHER